MDLTINRDRKIADWFSEYSRRLLHFVRSRLDDLDEAEDVAQDVWLQLTRLDRLDDIEQIGNWLFAAARNRVVNVYKKRKNIPFSQLETRRTDDSDDPENPENDLPDDLLFDNWLDENLPGAALESREFWQAFEAALEKLPAEQRAVFVAHEFEERSFREMAEQTGENPNTLMARKRYAIRRLQKELADWP